MSESDYICPDSLDCSCIPNSSSLPPPAFGAPVVPLLPLVPVRAFVGLAVWFLFLLLGDLLVDRADRIPAIRVEVQPQPPALQIRPVPAIEVEEQSQPERETPPSLEVSAEAPFPDEQAPLIRVIWDAAAVHAVCSDIKARIPDSGRQARLFDSDSDSGYDSDASGSSCFGVETYPSLHHLEVVGISLVHPNSMAHLDQKLRNLSDEQRQETIRRACPRFCDVIENALMHHVRREALSVPHVLTDNSTKDWILRLKSTAIICLLMWKQLKEQNEQLYRELKENCFAEVAGQSIVNLLNVASSFSDARWSASHIKYMLPIFDTLLEVLDYIKEIPFSKSDTIRNKVNDIYSKIVKNMCGILVEIAHDKRVRNESCIHPATNYLIQALKCFYRNKDMLQAVFSSPDYTDDLHNRWVGKLEEEARRIFENENDLQYIFILNNACFVLQKLRDPKILLPVEVNRVDSVIQIYKKSYLDVFWTPHVTCVEGASSRRRLNQLKAICSSRRILKVRTELKGRLINEIMDLSRGQNGIFSRSSDELRKSFFDFLKKRKSEPIAVADFEVWLRGLFER